ncbi:uncharacterized protein LOC142064166 isoform X2 [Phalacrocorax aristotelis]|uniref:uncharacterized protein LOC142064162 isoform X2 n=1 Tax=Phalacrocorax aristotelis TaxID=126867 RepID=UPI003F4C8BF6
MDPRLLDLPLGVKIPVLPGSKPVFCRAKLGEKLQRPSCYFDLGDPYGRRLPTEYNSLHDPHLRAYHKRQDNLQRLKRGGFVTSDGKVVCTLKEFNEYRQYLTGLKLEAEYVFRREEERLRQRLATLRDAHKPLGTIDASCLLEQLRQPQRPPCPPPPASRKISLKSGRCRRLKAALDEGQTCSQPELGQEGAELPRRVSSGADSGKQPDRAADSVSRAASQQQAATEAQKLEEEIGRVAKELVATVLESLAKALTSSMATACEPGPAGRRKERPVAGGATRAEEEKSGQAETAASDGASAEASLDKLIREVVDGVCCTLESFATSQVERDPSCKYSNSLELPGRNLSKRQAQPSQAPFSRQAVEQAQGLPRASQQQSLEASKGPKSLALQPLPNRVAADASQLSGTTAGESIQNASSGVQQHHAERAGYATTVVPEVLATAPKFERELTPKPTALANTLAIRTMASRIIDSVLERSCQPGPALSPRLNFGRCVAKLPAPSDGKESYPAEDVLPSVCPHFSGQPVVRRVRSPLPGQEHSAEQCA